MKLFVTTNRHSMGRDSHICGRCVGIAVAKQCAAATASANFAGKEAKEETDTHHVGSFLVYAQCFA